MAEAFALRQTPPPLQSPLQTRISIGSQHCYRQRPLTIDAPQKLMGLKLHNLMVLKLSSTGWLILLKLTYTQSLSDNWTANPGAVDCL